MQKLTAKIASKLRVFAPVRGPLTTEEARSHYRYRQAALASVAAVLAKLAAMAATLITIPVTSRYLGSERFGMWLTSSSIVAMFGFADLGLSNGLINLVADAHARNDRTEARAAVASAFWMLTATACFLLLVVLGGYKLIPWPHIFNVHTPQAVGEAGPMFLVMILCFAVTLPLSSVGSIQNALQNGLITNLWAISGSLLSLIGVYFATKNHANLSILMVFLSAGPLFGSTFNALQLFLIGSRWLFPWPHFFSKKVAARLLQTGLMFFSMQIAIALGYQSDNLVIAHILGPNAVVSYAVPSRLFNILPLLIGIFTAPLWPAYANAIASNDVLWIGRTFRKTVIWAGSVTVAMTVILVLSGNAILRVWIGPSMHVSWALLIAFGFRCVLSAYLQPLSFLLNGIGKLKEQAVIAFAMSVGNLILSIVLVRHFGVVGAILGTVVAEVAIVLVPESIIASRALKALRHPDPRGENS